MGTTIKIHRGDDSGAFGGHLFSITNTEALYDIKTVEIGFGVVKLRYSQPQEGDMFPIVVDLDVVQTNVNGIGDYPISVTAYDSNDRRLLIDQSCTLSVVPNSESIPTPYELTVLFDIADVMPTSSDEPEPYDPGESPRRGKQYYNTETDRLLVFNGDTYDVIAYSDDAPSAHTHGNISNTGAVGTTANLPLITGTNGVVQTGTFGNSANTFCEGNDSRLSDARTPTAHTHGNNDITGIDASKINSGTIDLDRLPQGALDRLVKVANQSERFALTTASVQNGDTVQQLDTGLMYRVVDDTKLNSEDGYAKYTADRASAVPWSGVTDKPSTFTPSSHTHSGSEIISAVDKSETSRIAENLSYPNYGYPQGAILALSAKGLTTAGIAEVNGVKDLSGNNNHCQAFGGVSVIHDDEMGDCFRFVSSENTEKIKINNDIEFNENGLTIIFNLKKTGFPSGDGYAMVLDLRKSNSGQIGYFLIDSSKKMYFNASISNNLSWSIISGNIQSEVANECLVVARVSNGKATLKIGNLEYEDNSAVFVPTENQKFSVTIGQSHSSYQLQPFKGLISNILIFSRALTDHEIKSLSVAPTSPKAMGEMLKTVSNFQNVTSGNANTPIYLNNGVPTVCTLTTSVVTELPSTPDSNTIYIVVEEDEPVSLNMSRSLNLQQNSFEPIEESEIEEVEPVIEEEPETIEHVEEPVEQEEER